MSEAVLLALLARYPHRVAAARRVGAGALQQGVPRLERAGFVVAERDAYRVTARGRSALEFERRLQATIRRARGARRTPGVPVRADDAGRT